MVEHRPLMTRFSHLVLIGGVLLVALPIWITFVASSHPPEAVFQVPSPIWPGDQLYENYATVLSSGLEAAGAEPVAIMMLNSLINDGARGIPKIFRQILVEGSWVDGATLPPRC